jgi:hypothetical protein
MVFRRLLTKKIAKKTSKKTTTKAISAFKPNKNLTRRIKSAMTPKQKAALKKAQLASAKARKGLKNSRLGNTLLSERRLATANLKLATLDRRYTKRAARKLKVSRKTMKSISKEFTVPISTSSRELAVIGRRFQQRKNMAVGLGLIALEVGTKAYRRR